MNSPLKNIGLAIKNTQLATQVAKELIKILKENKIEISCINQCQDAEILKDAPLIQEDEIKDKCQAIFVLGGDGTFIRYFMQAARAHIPILGINCGRVGFLTDVPRDAMARMIPEIIKGDYLSTNKLIIQGRIDGIKEDIHSINEISVQSIGGRIMESELSIDGKFVYCERSDGIIIASPAGSSAHALSAGGVLIVPDSQSLEVVSISPKNLTSRPLVLPDSSKIRIELKSEKDVGVFADGQQVGSISKNQQIEIEKDELKLNLLQHKNYDIFATYRSKLGWHS